MKPVPDIFVRKVISKVSPQVAAMIQLQELTGMRPGEVTAMRTCDLTTSGRTWEYRPASHKTTHHGHDRVIYIGPKAKRVLKPWLCTNLQEYLFSPADAELLRNKKRREERQSPMTPSQARRRPKKNRGRPPSDHYTVGAYRRAIEYDTGREVRAIPELESVPIDDRVSQRAWNVTRVMFSPDGRFLATSTWSGQAGISTKVSVWDAETGRLWLPGRSSHIDWHWGDTGTCIAYSQDDTKLVTGDSSGDVQLWDALTGKSVGMFPPGKRAAPNIQRSHNGVVCAVAISPDGTRVASASMPSKPGKPELKMWDARSAEELSVTHPEIPVHSLAFSPDGRMLATTRCERVWVLQGSAGIKAEGEHVVRLLDARTFADLRVLSGHRGPVLSVAFSTEGGRLATGGADAVIKLWDVDSAQEIRTLRGHDGPVLCVAFDPAGQRLASASTDGSVRIWDCP